MQQVKCNTTFNISLGMLVTDLVAYKIFWEVSGKTLHELLMCIVQQFSHFIHHLSPFIRDYILIYCLYGISTFLNNFVEQLSGAILVGFSSFTFGALDNRVIKKWVSLAVQTNWLLKPFSTNPNFSESRNKCMPEAELSGTFNWLLCFKFAFSSTLVTFSKLNFQLGFFQCSKIVCGLQEDKKRSSREVAWEFCRLFWSFLRFWDFCGT